jgi:hypothetical protein
MKSIIHLFRMINAFLVLAVLAYAFPAQADQRAIIEFDPSGSVATIPQAINAADVITGTYLESSGVARGFVRAADGAITSFEYPTAALIGNFTFINPEGVVTGNYFDTTFTFHSFVRSTHGTVTSLDIVDEKTGTFQGTFAVGINPAGVIIGNYTDANFAAHGFVRAKNGIVTTFDPTGSTGTSPAGINSEGVITGSYSDSSGVQHGFLRAKDGAISTFDFPGATGVNVVGINPDGTVAGYSASIIFTPPNIFTLVGHGFVRAKNGTIATVDPPGSTSTIVAGISPGGEITGNYNDAGGVTHGFVRAKNGTITTVDPRGSTSTFVAGISPGGEITGNYNDAGGVTHGFLFRGDDD